MIRRPGPLMPSAVWWRRRRARSRARRRAPPAPSVGGIPPAASALAFFPAPRPGSFDLPEPALWEGRPQRRRSRPPPAYHDVRPAERPALALLVDEALAQGVLRLLPEQVEPNLRLVVKAKDGRAKLMADARAANKTFSRPPRCRWPRPSDVVGALPSLGDGPFCFATLDIRRFYDSLRLPHSLRSTFVTYVTDPETGTRRDLAFNVLPFGWSWAPFLAQQVSTSLVASWLRESGFRGSVLASVYFDDVLLASRQDDSSTLRRAALSLQAFLQSHGLLVNLAKSSLVPGPVARYLGFTLCARGTATVSNGVGPRDVRRALNGRSSWRTRATVVGAIRWHRPRVAPLLRPLEMTLRSPGSLYVPRAAIGAAAEAALIARSQPVTPTPPVGVFAKGDSVSRVLVFVDASATSGRAGYVLCEADRVCAVRSLTIPRWVRSPVDAAPERLQQVCELFALVCAVGFAFSLRSATASSEPPLVVSDSTSAIFSLLRGRARDLRRSLILRRALHYRRFDLAYIVSSSNPADGPSRAADATVSARDVAVALSRLSPPPQLWPRSCVPPLGLLRPPQRVAFCLPSDHVDRPHASMRRPRLTRS